MRRTSSSGQKDLPQGRSFSSAKNHPDIYPTPTEELIDYVKQMEADFPSSGNISRLSYFYRIFYQIMNNHRLSYSKKASDEAFLQLQLQNQLITILRYGLDDWITNFKPDEFTLFQVSLIVVSECIFSSGPKVPSLPNELFELSQHFCSKTLKRTFNQQKIINENEHLSEKIEERDYWAKRVPIPKKYSSSSFEVSKSKGNSSSAENSDILSFTVPTSHSVNFPFNDD